MADNQPRPHDATVEPSLVRRRAGTTRSGDGSVSTAPGSSPRSATREAADRDGNGRISPSSASFLRESSAETEEMTGTILRSSRPRFAELVKGKRDRR
jgi:hypothetical protein